MTPVQPIQSHAGLRRGSNTARRSIFTYERKYSNYPDYGIYQIPGHISILKVSS